MQTELSPQHASILCLAGKSTPLLLKLPSRDVTPDKENAHMFPNSHTGKEHLVCGEGLEAYGLYIARQEEEKLLWLILLFSNIQQIHTDCFP